MTFSQEFSGTLGPNSPVAEEAANDAEFFEVSVDLETIGREQVHYDVVVVPGVERDFAARFGHRANHIECVIAIERRNFYCDHILDLHEAPPEPVGKNAATDGRLKIKAHDRQDRGNLATMAKESFVLQIL